MYNRNIREISAIYDVLIYIYYGLIFWVCLVYYYFGLVFCYLVQRTSMSIEFTR